MPPSPRRRRPTLSVLDGPLGVDSLRQPWQLLDGAIGSNTLEAVDLDATGITDLVFESAGFTVLVEAGPGGGRVDDLATWRFATTPWDTARVPDTDHDGLDELLIGEASSAWLIFGAP